MLSVIAFFAAVVVPACPVPSSPADAISATKMPVEAAGGAYVAGMPDRHAEMLGWV